MLAETMGAIVGSPAFTEGIAAGAGLWYAHVSNKTQKRDRHLALVRGAAIDLGKMSDDAPADTTNEIDRCDDYCAGCGDTREHRIMEWTPDGRYLCWFCRNGTATR